jgi:hypothetical protein
VYRSQFKSSVIKSPPIQAHENVARRVDTHKGLLEQHEMDREEMDSASNPPAVARS